MIRELLQITTPETADENDAIAVSASDLSLNGLDLYITTTCDRRCAHCFLTDEWLNSQQTMPLETVASITRWASAPGSTIDEITLLGGEPSTHPDFVNIAKVIHDAKFGARVVTNGSPAFRAALEAHPELADHLTRTSLSIDAPDPEAHDKIRGRGTFDWTLATAAMLRERGMPFDINMTVLKDNVNSISRMLDHAEELGAQRLNIHWFSLTGRGRRHAADQVPTVNKWRRVLDVVLGHSSNASNLVVDCELGYAYGLHGEDTDMCKVRDGSNLQISPDGSALACGMLAEAPSKSGYMWKEGMLYKRGGANDEIALTQNSDCTGCPLRQESDGFTPLCIYNRLEA